MTAAQIRTKVTELKGARFRAQADYKRTRSKYITAYRAAAATEEAKALLQKVAKQTQDQLRYHITELGSMALDAVFGNGTKLDLEFQEKAGKTVAVLQFKDSEGRPTDPLSQDSGGAADIAALALRCSLWSMQHPRTRAVMVLDEPLKNINDPSREMQRRAAEMIKQVSERLGMQFIVVTMLPELAEVADNVINL